MTQKYSDVLEMSESGNWNVAKPYTEIKIMKWLFLADEYETVALFGTSDMLSEFELSEEIIKIARIKALDRLNHTLTKLIRNTRFALKTSTDKESFDKYLKDLEFIKKHSIYCYKIGINQQTKQRMYTIKEEEFRNIVNLYINIHTEILGPLNKANLIFTQIDQMDPDEFKRKLKEDIIYAG